MRERYLRFPEGKEKAVTFSYDDGCRADVRMSETLQKYGMKGTFNINSAMMGKEPGKGKLTPEEIQKYLLDKGHEIAVHGNMHKTTGLTRSVEAIEDVLTCRLKLEKTFGKIVRGMAYPGSGIRKIHNQTSYEEIRQFLRQLDIVYARTLDGDNDSFDLPQDWYAWMPTAYHRNPKVLEYADAFAALDCSSPCVTNKSPRLFYLWGHSYEFDNDANWDLLETLCEKLSGKQDTWYATNIEIYNYVNAYNSLVFSADGMLVHNPTIYKVWFWADGKIYSIEAGQLLDLEMFNSK